MLAKMTIQVISFEHDMRASTPFLKVKKIFQTLLEENDKIATMPLISPQVSLSHGLETNVNGGTYSSGAVYAMTKKLEVEEAIL